MVRMQKIRVPGTGRLSWIVIDGGHFPVEWETSTLSIFIASRRANIEEHRAFLASPSVKT